ncbi:MAG: metallophosphoesterase [Bacteroidales bacterium]|nr:metallophosphoesterase [Bacteroidales bacterium]
MKRHYLPLAIAFLSMGILVSCSKNGDNATPAPDDGFRKFVILSDIHLMHPDLLVHEGKAFEKYNWEECKLLRESPEVFAATLERVRAYNPDFLIVCGDMTKDGEIISHEYVAEKLEDFSKQTGARVLVVPGNHDLDNPHSFRYDGAFSTPEPSATEADFKRIYGRCGYDDAVERGPRPLDYMSYPVEGIAFIGLDSNEKNTPDKLLVQGGLSKAQAQWVADMVGKAHADNRYVIMGMHHNLIEFYNNASLIRGSNITNARYDDYPNGQLVTDLCGAGIDVVFSGHSHMHSITSERRDERRIFSVVTSSLVNLPLAYRTGTVSKDGLMTVRSGYMQDVMPSNGVNLREEGKRYWFRLSEFYMYEASRVCWDNEIARVLFSDVLDLGSREELEEVLSEKAGIPFYKFTYYTSNGNEHLYDPDKNSEEARAALDSVVDYVLDGIAQKWMEEDEELEYDEAVEGAKASVDVLLTALLGMGLDDAREMLYDFLDSAFHNYYGKDRTPVPDDCLTLQLSR